MKLKFFVFFVFLFSVFAFFAYATLYDQTSNSPQDEWWMLSGNLSLNNYAHSNVPSNLTSATIINRSLGTTVSRNPIIVGNYLYIIPANSARFMKMSALDIRNEPQNSTSTYTLNMGSPTYYDGKFYIHSDGNLLAINASNISQILDSENIADGIYYGVPIVFNNSVYIGDGNAAPRFKQFNASNISQVLASYSTTGRIYESSPKNSRYFYWGETSQLRQVNASNISQLLNSFSCAANGIAWNFPVSDEYVYKTCTVNGTNIIQQLNATNISRVVSNFTNGTVTSTLGNGYLYVSVGGIAYQLNATNISHVLSNFSLGTGTSGSVFPLVTRDYYFVPGGSVLYQLNATNVSHMISNRSFPTTISSGVVAAKGFLYVGAGNFLYQLGTYNPLTDADAPLVTLNSPVSGYSNDTAVTYNANFNCAAIDGYSIVNISLYLTNSNNASFSLNQTSSTSGTSVSGIWNVSLGNGNYTWNCLATDESNNYGFSSSNRSIIINSTDRDNDGYADLLDRLIGNSSSVTTSGISNLNVTVNGTSANGTFSGVHEMAFYDSGNILANFSFNFSSSVFNLNNVTLIKGTNYIITNFSGQVPAIYNKTIYIEDNNFETLCLKDQEISAISEVGSSCTGTNETDITTCLGSSSIVNFGSITCRDSGDTVILGNLRNSAVLGVPVAGVETEEEEIFDDGRGSYISEFYTEKKSLVLKFLSNAGLTLSTRISNDKETGIKEFEIKTKDWITGEISISKYDHAPDRCQIKKEDYILYKALNFEHDFDNNYIDEARVRIEVSKDWILNNKIREIEVVRCYPEYQELKLSYISESEDFALYDIYSKGFSVFAIVGTLEDQKVKLAPSKDMPRWLNFFIPFIIVVILLVYLIIKFVSIKGLKEDWHFKNKWFDFEFKFKIKTPPHRRKFLHDY